MEAKQLVAALRELATDESRWADISALAARHGIEIGSGELDDAALDAIAGGDAVSALSEEIRTYLKAHPSAVDTLSGVSQWWEGKR